MIDEIITCGEFDPVSRGKVFLPLIVNNYFLADKVNVAYSYLMHHKSRNRDIDFVVKNLENGANFKAENLAKLDYFAHKSPEGINANKLARQFGVSLPSFYSENGNSIESLLGGVEDPTKMIDFLLQSPSHRNHLLGIGEPFVNQNNIGIGYYYGENSRYKHYWCIWITELM